jgi:hypothetical protein
MLGLSSERYAYGRGIFVEDIPRSLPVSLGRFRFHTTTKGYYNMLPCSYYSTTGCSLDCRLLAERDVPVLVRRACVVDI